MYHLPYCNAVKLSALIWFDNVSNCPHAHAKEYDHFEFFTLLSLSFYEGRFSAQDKMSNRGEQTKVILVKLKDFNQTQNSSGIIIIKRFKVS